LTCAAIFTRIAEACVNRVLALVAMVTGRALAAVLLETNQVTGAAMLAWVREADVAFCKDLRICLVCIEHTKQHGHCTNVSLTYG
jgi:hypothetical protein